MLLHSENQTAGVAQICDPSKSLIHQDYAEKEFMFKFIKKNDVKKELASGNSLKEAQISMSVALPDYIIHMLQRCNCQDSKHIQQFKVIFYDQVIISTF